MGTYIIPEKQVSFFEDVIDTISIQEENHDITSEELRSILSDILRNHRNPSEDLNIIENFVKEKKTLNHPLHHIVDVEKNQLINRNVIQNLPNYKNNTRKYNTSGNQLFEEFSTILEQYPELHKYSKGSFVVDTHRDVYLNINNSYIAKGVEPPSQYNLKGFTSSWIPFEYNSTIQNEQDAFIQSITSKKTPGVLYDTETQEYKNVQFRLKNNEITYKPYSEVSKVWRRVKKNKHIILPEKKPTENLNTAMSLNTVILINDYIENVHAIQKDDTCICAFHTGNHITSTCTAIQENIITLKTQDETYEYDKAFHQGNDFYLFQYDNKNINPFSKYDIMNGYVAIEQTDDPLWAIPSTVKQIFDVYQSITTLYEFFSVYKWLGKQFIANIDDLKQYIESKEPQQEIYTTNPLAGSASLQPHQSFETKLSREEPNLNITIPSQLPTEEPNIPSYSSSFETVISYWLWNTRKLLEAVQETRVEESYFSSIRRKKKPQHRFYPVYSIEPKEKLRKEDIENQWSLDDAFHHYNVAKEALQNKEQSSYIKDTFIEEFIHVLGFTQLTPIEVNEIHSLYEDAISNISTLRKLVKQKQWSVYLVISGFLIIIIQSRLSSKNPIYRPTNEQYISLFKNIYGYPIEKDTTNKGLSEYISKVFLIAYQNEFDEITSFHQSKIASFIENTINHIFNRYERFTLYIDNVRQYMDGGIPEKEKPLKHLERFKPSTQLTKSSASSDLKNLYNISENNMTITYTIQNIPKKSAYKRHVSDEMFIIPQQTFHSSQTRTLGPSSIGSSRINFGLVTSTRKNMPELSEKLIVEKPETGPSVLSNVQNEESTFPTTYIYPETLLDIQNVSEKQDWNSLRDKNDTILEDMNIDISLKKKFIEMNDIWVFEYSIFNIIKNYVYGCVGTKINTKYKQFLKSEKKRRIEEIIKQDLRSATPEKNTSCSSWRSTKQSYPNVIARTTNNTYTQIAYMNMFLNLLYSMELSDTDLNEVIKLCVENNEWIKNSPQKTYETLQQRFTETWNSEKTMLQEKYERLRNTDVEFYNILKQNQQIANVYLDAEGIEDLIQNISDNRLEEDLNARSPENFIEEGYDIDMNDDEDMQYD